ncbi:MAG: hypothetical protein ABWW65_02205 [Thermoprotei archaeon]
MSVRFSGVIISYEEVNGEKAVYVQGSVNSKETFYYLLLPSKLYEEYSKKGVGIMINGLGEIVSEKPLIIRVLRIE